MSESRVGFGFGSNLGDSKARIDEAIGLIEQRRIARLDRVSRVYRTAPWGVTDQDDFANACAVGWTTLSAYELLAAVKRIEADMGRLPTRRWGPRVIDVDILFLGESVIDDPELTIPHKELFSRAFVLAPLAEIAPELRLGGTRIATAAEIADLSGVHLWDEDAR